MESQYVYPQKIVLENLSSQTMSISLNSSPVDIWRVSPRRTAEIQHLNAAKVKLREEDLPLSTRAISYVRICSVVMQILVKDLGGNMPQSYSTILAALHSQDAKWWLDCYVDAAGLLQSKNPKVQAFIQPLNDFIQNIL